MRKLKHEMFRKTFDVSFDLLPQRIGMVPYISAKSLSSITLMPLIKYIFLAIYRLCLALTRLFYR